MKTTRQFLASSLTALVLIVAACGDDDGGAAAPTDTTAETVSEVTEAQGVPDETAEEGSAQEEAAGSGSSIDTWCESLVAYFEVESGVLERPYTKTPEEVEAALGEASGYVEQVRALMPAELNDAAEDLPDPTVLYGVIEDHDWDVQAALESPEGYNARALFDSAEWQTASVAFFSFVGEHCPQG